MSLKPSRTKRSHFSKTTTSPIAVIVAVMAGCAARRNKHAVGATELDKPRGIAEIAKEPEDRRGVHVRHIARPVSFGTQNMHPQQLLIKWTVGVATAAVGSRKGVGRVVDPVPSSVANAKAAVMSHARGAEAGER